MQLDRRRREFRDEAGVIKKFGVPPASIPDYLALVGDASDGYPGLRGWGPKSTAAVLARFGHLESIPEDSRNWHVNAAQAGSLAATLIRERERAFLFRDLATLRTNIPLFDSVDELKWTGPRPSLPRLGNDGSAVTADEVNARLMMAGRGSPQLRALHADYREGSGPCTARSCPGCVSNGRFAVRDREGYVLGFGQPLTAVRPESCAEIHPLELCHDNLVQDIRYGVRMLFSSPDSPRGDPHVGARHRANTAIFSVVNAVLLKPCRTPTGRSDGLHDDRTAGRNTEDRRPNSTPGVSRAACFRISRLSVQCRQPDRRRQS